MNDYLPEQFEFAPEDFEELAACSQGAVY